MYYKVLIITIHNDGTGTEEVGNYDYKVIINDKVIKEGKIEGHYREDGWRDLVMQVASYDFSKGKIGRKYREVKHEQRNNRKGRLMI